MFIDSAVSTMVDFTQHPVKGVYALAALGLELVRFPLFIVKFLFFGRQHPSWTFRQAITVHALFSGLWHVATVQAKTPLPLTPDREKERFLVIKPAKDDVYKGPLRSNKDVVPAEIGATWFPAPLTMGSDKSNVKVVLHIHGGAFVTGQWIAFVVPTPVANFYQETEGRDNAELPQRNFSSTP